MVFNDWVEKKDCGRVPQSFLCFDNYEAAICFNGCRQLNI